MSCEKCTDPDGVGCFPIYGLGPHLHGAGYLGATVILPQEAEGFTPDPDEPGMGVWWCPYCEDGKPAKTPPDRADASLDPLNRMQAIDDRIGDQP